MKARWDAWSHKNFIAAGLIVALGALLLVLGGGGALAWLIFG